jgi:hypothetical protein
MAKKEPELDETAKRALELHRVEGEILRALAPLDPDARARAFAAVLVMQSTELAKHVIQIWQVERFPLDAKADASVSITYDKGSTDG